jgi:hypothetical protein
MEPVGYQLCIPEPTSRPPDTADATISRSNAVPENACRPVETRTVEQAPALPFFVSE